MLKKFGEKITKKGLLIAGGIAIALVAIIIAIAIVSSKGEGTKKKSFTPDSELARAMTYDQFTDADSNIDGTDYVKFGAFFLRDINNDGYAEKIKGTCKQIGKEDTLYMELNVLTNGYLENGVITINSNNFYLQTAIPKDSEVKDNVISNNTKQISLNQINNGTQKLLTGIVRTGDYSYDSQKFAAIGNDTTKYSKVNSVTLTGTHVAADGTRTQINKTVEFNMDWYGTTKAEIPSYIAGVKNLNQSKDNTNVVDEENEQAVFEFDIGIQETNNQLILSKTHLEGTIPQLNGYDPAKVEIVDSNATFTYDEATRVFQVEKLTELNADGTVSMQCYDGTYSGARYNKFKLKVIYPLDAYNTTGSDTVELKIPVNAYYEGYNNTNTEFSNPYKSNIAAGTIVVTYSKPTGDVARFDVIVGKYMSSPSWKYIVSKKKPLRIYNEISTEENDDTYIVKWYGSTGSEGQSTGMTMKETKNGEAQVIDQFIKADSTTERMENITTNIGIYFGDSISLLGENGWIKVYDDETGNLIHEFTKADWSKYTENNPYKYDVQVKHVRVETSETEASQSISVYHVKKLDDEYITKNYTREQFDNLKYIKSTLTGYIGNSYINTDTHSAHYEAPYSFAKISLSKNAISTQETEKDMQIKIEAMGDENANQEKWQNGAFLVKLPKDIVDIDVSSVVSSTSSVTVMSYESFEENGERFIKIITANTNPTIFTLTINCSVTPDPRIATVSENVELYASNENGVGYFNPVEDIYDVNDNLNKSEKVNKSTVSLSLISPNSLLTNQIATNYDENGSTVVAPQIAVVSKERRSATVNVEINNNYSSTISEVKILGRVPFEGNKYAINGQNMGSTFTATMTNEGIQLPTALKDVAKVYYSTNGEATQDLTNTKNGWTQTPSDYSKIKSYLIDLSEHQLAKGEKHTISYNINIPAGLSYNKVAYSHHAVYFSLDTTEGKYRTQTEPNKIGFMIAKQYDLELTKYQKGKSKIVSGATYAVYEDGNEEARTRVTGVDGKLTLTGLYVDKTYVVKEVKSPDDYELNAEVVKFTTSESDGKLNVTKNEGTVKNIQAVQPTATEGYKVQLEVEDEVKVRLKIKKTEKGTTIPAERVGYKLTGTGLPAAGKNITTNANGEVTVKGLKVGEEYTLEETKANGYYLADTIKFTVTNTNGTYTVNVSEGTVKASIITEENSIPTINISLEDEKIPTYDLEITKIKKVTSVTEGESGTQQEAITYLKDAKFKLYKGEKELGTYVTDENGKLTIPRLYQYIDGKDEEATYVLKETLAPEGYAKVKDITFKVDGTTGELKFINTDGTEENYTIDGTTVKLTIEDSPSFKLIKKDAETGARLAGIKFSIYNVDEGATPAKNSKGEILGTKEIINGKEYYTVTTDSNGELTADLTEGMYKAVEVQAPDKYDISEPYYFGIGTSREGKMGVKAVWAQGIGGTADDQITSVVETTDRGYIVGGYFKSSSIDLGNGMSLNNSTSAAYSDGMLIKYGSSGEVEWAKGIGGMSYDYINSVSETRDGGYIVGGYFNSSSIDLGNGINLNNSTSTVYSDGMLIKYGSSGEVEWAKGIGGTFSDHINSVSETSDGGYIVGGYFNSSSIDLGNGISLARKGSNDGMLIKYGSSGEVEWAKGIGGESGDSITSVSETIDGGYIVVGEFYSSSIDLGNGISLATSGSQDGMLIKYGSSGEVEWAKGIGGKYSDSITSVLETTDGGYIVGGEFNSSRIDLENGISLTLKNVSDGMLIKYGSSGEVEWAKVIGGEYGDSITSVSETKDGGYIVGGSFYSSSINLENGISLTNNGNGDGMVIKYSGSGEVEWAKGIGGTSDDRINSVSETKDGGYIVGGYFYSSSIDLGNEISLANANSGSYDGMVIKFDKVEIPNPTVVEAKRIGGTSSDQINSVVETSDGGYIVGGYFQSESIDLGNEISLANVSGASIDGMIIKYGSGGEVEWAKVIGGTGTDEINSVVETSDGGYIVVGYFYSYSIDLGNGISLANSGSRDGMVIKYSSSGEVEWSNEVGGTGTDEINSVAETIDGGYVVGGYFNGSIDLGNGISLNSKGSNDGMLIKYGSSREVEWAKVIGGTNYDEINSVAETKDGGCIVGGYFQSESIDLGNGITLVNSGSYDGMLIKYGSSGEVEWSKEIGGSYRDIINSVAKTSDGGYLVGGYFHSYSIDLGNGINLKNQSNSTSYNDGMLIKYGSSGEVEWAQEIGGNLDEYVKLVAETIDGGYIAVGYFYSYSIDLGNEISLANVSGGSTDGMIIKYGSGGEVEWAKGIGGTSHDRIDSVAVTTDGDYIVGGYFESSSIDLNNGKTLINNGNSDGMVLKITDQMGVPEIQELEVANKRKEFKITTEVNEIDEIKGGSISGEDKKPYESVMYGDSSKKEIKMVPDESYEIIGITVNGDEYKFTKNADGSYTMPQFTNMIEDKHIVVTYSLKDNKITINKIDKDTKAKLPGATFKLDQIEERAEPNNASIIGSLTDNGQEYTKITVTTEVSDKIGTLTNNGTYYFVQNSDGTYTPTNSKTYQTANGGTAGIHSTTANSYIPIDLTGLTGTYAVVINASCSSESPDYGYATIAETTTAPSYSTGTGRFMYVSGTSSSKDYTSAILDGGNKYYLHLGYRKDSSVDTNADQVVINSIKLYNATSEVNAYNFINNNGKYESTNAGKDSTVANSYIPIDLTNYTGKYNLIANAEISSESKDYGYVTITENTTRPSYDSSSGRFIYVSGTQRAQDYTTVLQGGKMYYLHLGYYKNASGSSGDDKFTVNSVNIALNDSELYHVTVETNSDGQAITQIPFGKYSITEAKAPDGYWLNETPTIVEFRSTDEAVHEFTIEDEAKAKLIVHHYIKGTTTKLADDENDEAHAGDSYTTNPKLDLDKYELEKDSNGAFVLPANAVGKYKTGTTEVTYYYVEKQIPLTVHHYIEGTTDKVPLKAGGTASDVTGSGKEGESYTTSAIADDKLSDEYELVEIPSNASGTYSGNEVVVTYYYKKVARDVNLVKYKEDGKIPLAGAKFRINGVEYTTNENGKIKANLEVGTYDVIETEAPDGYKLPSNPITKVTITKATPETINITNEKKTGTVTVHHYIEGTTTKVPLAAGGTADDEVKTGNVGDIYATKARTDISNTYELVSEPSNGSGTYIDGNIEVIYYYRSIATSVLVHHYLEETTTKLADDVIHDGIVGDNYTTGVAPVDSKYEVVAIPANANGKMTREPIVVIYYYRLKNTSVLVHHYKEGTSESLSKDVTITGKVDDAYTTSVATDIPSKYELVATPTNASGKMTVAQTVVTYYYRLKSTGVDVHYYKEGTTEKVSNDVAIEGKVDQSYTTTPATDVASKYELVGTPTNATGTMTESRITVIYYYRLKDTSVLVHHYLENTTTKLADDVTINGKVDSSYKTVANTDLLAGKYELVAEPTNKSGIMTEAQIVVIYYYRVKDTSVLVHHYKEGTTEKISEDVTIDGKIDEEYTTTIADDLPEYYELVAEPTNKSGTMTEEQIVVIYYYRLKKYPYTVNYLEKDTGNVLHDAKQGGALTYGSTVNSSDEKINIDGYKFDSYDKETLTIGTKDNVINIYYTKSSDLSYKVNYLEKGTNKVLHDQKVQDGMTFDSEVTASDEVIDIDGYNYDSVDKTTLKITTGENVINIYYTKRNDLSYTVNYLEKDTNKVLHNPKNQTGMTFGDIITSSTEVIDIDGYDYNSVDKNSIAIGTSENVINIYYTKRTDLRYKVNYLEKGTNKVLHDQKVQGGMTFESVVDSSKEVIDIDGYNYDSVDKATLTIGTGENVINIYYTKRTDLSYTVNYLEKTTNKVLHNPKTVENKTFGDVINSVDEKIDIDGYNYDSVDKDTLTITTGENVINIYYTKRNDLSYTVNYLEKTTNKILHNPKTVENKTFGDVIQSADEKIEIDGYNYDSVDKETLTITTGENVINIYYTKRTDLSYKVNYLEKGTNKVLHGQKVQDGMTFDAEVKSADEVIDINGYKFDSADKESIKITTGENVINIYYTKVDGLSYTVNYLEKGTNEVINPAKTKDGMTFEDVVTSRDEIISIDGYNYDSVDRDTLVIGTGENVINIYYTKRTDLSYKVNYLEKGTNKVLHDQKVQENMTFKATVKSSDEVIDIDGYDYDSVDKDTLTITTGENVINIYYTKRTDLSYKVNYLEKETNKVLHDQKVQDGMTFESTVKSSDEVIDIDGYDYDSVDKETLTITTGENIINIYYTKRNDLSYKVNYLEKTTNKVLHDQKVQDGMTFESVVTSANEVIDIDGYNYDSVDKETLTITTGENVINIYYTKRNDLSYTVNYLEKDTNIVLHEPKVTENMTFETEITSSKEVIDIDGYNYDSVDKETLTITTGENIINIYYTKRNDLSYTVNYLEKGTNRTIHAPKVTQNMTFGTEITSSKEVITINGYSYDSVDKASLIITTGENVINIYYTKVSGLSYTVNYLEKDTNEVLQAPKTKGDMTFEDEIISSNEVIDIDGYNYDSVDKDKLVIGTGENVINIYYTKRTDLSYTVNYLEKDTNKVLHDQKTQDGMTFESVVTSADEVIDIDGYNYDSVDKETLTITTEENVINIYYTKRTDLSYTVNYLEKDTNNVLHEQKVQDGMTFESTVNSADEVISIYGYKYDSVDKDTLTITTGENVINIYYTKKDTKVTVHYYEEGTTNKVSEDVEIPGKVFDDYTTESASDIPSKYELVAEPENKNGTMTEDEITVIYYYRKKTTQVIVHYYEENTTKKLSEDVIINGRVDDPYTTVSADDIPIKYELVAEPVNKAGSMTEATIEVIYYYRVKDAVVHVRYLEKGTNIVLADPDKLDGKVDDDYQTTPKEIDGFQLVEHTGNEKGKFEVEPLTITYYYLYKTKATVQYIDKITGQILEQSTTEGLEGDDFITESKDFENYVLVEEPPEKTVKMTKEEQILKYYYIHVSGGVIEKHIDVISGQILANAVHNGNEGDAYDIPSRTFDGYDLVEDRLPSNAKGTMKVEPVEVIYYYIYRSKVTSEYIDKNTGEKLTEDVVQKGHEGDNYTTERKTFDDYKLVEVPSNADGSMTKEDIKVTYYYVHTSGGVIVNHIDIKTGKQLLDETKEEGYEGDPYETHEENIPEYDLVKEKYPENATGKMTIEPTRVTYYYIKKTEVNVKYVDKETGEEIDEPTNIPGHEGDDYNTEPKDVPGYDLIEEPENKDGTMTADSTEVIYYYKRPAKVIVNYYDIDIKEKLADEIEITGHQNDDYTTEQKDIKYYEIAKIPENKEGKMVVTVTKDENGKDIVDNTTYVNYYYRKLIFNLRVDKTIASVIVNGQETVINGTLGKVEVHRKNISTANVKVVYKIKVTNDSELTGKANVVENIPSGMTMLSENNPDWTIKETTASLETDEIKPGESREYQVVLGWQNGDNNVGTMTNMVSITTENEADFDEQFETDNESKADLIVAVGTGEVPYAKIAGGILLIMISITAGVYVISKKRQ